MDGDILIIYFELRQYSHYNRLSTNQLTLKTEWIDLPENMLE